MHTYRNLDGAWWVGHFEWSSNGPQPPTQNWFGVRSFATEAEAAAFCCYLNGGEHPQRQPSSPDFR